MRTVSAAKSERGVNPQQTQAAIARLVVLTGQQAGSKFTLKDGSVLGRSNATVVLDDASVSRRHAMILWEAGGFVIEDLQSKHGTCVNSSRVKRQALAFGDEITVGNVKLHFVEYEPIEDEILHRQRIEGLGRLVVGIAHELNNMLGAIAGNVELLREAPHETTFRDADVRACLGDIQDALKRTAELAPRMLNFVRQERPQHAVLNVSAVCRGVTKLIERTFDRAIRINFRITPSLLVVGEESALYQALMMLCLNARDRMLPDGGVLTISAKMRSAQGKWAKSSANTVIIAVHDTGPALDAADRAQLFEPIYGGAAQGELFSGGLSTTRDLLWEHGGDLVVDSKPPNGCTAQIILPAAATAAGTQDRLRQPPPLSTTVPLPSARSRTILIVDDEPMVRRIMERFLKQAGYRIITATDGRNALERYRAQAHPPDLILLDLDMPNMGGEETQRQLREIHPAARIIIVTGHNDKKRQERLRSAGALEILIKPVRRLALLEKIADAFLLP